MKRTPAMVEDRSTNANTIDAGKLRAAIDRRFPVADTAAAHAYVESGRKERNVIISVAKLG